VTKLGITGNRHGITKAQEKAFLDWFLTQDITSIHHGDCVGADIDVVNLIVGVCPRINTVCHPPIKSTLRAFHKSTETRECKDYLERNRDIVDETDRLVGFPDGAEKLRSGTWSTIRYAKWKGKPVFIFYPDGIMEKRRYI